VRVAGSHHIRFLAVCAVAVSAAAHVVLAGGLLSGTIEICRQPGVVDTHAGKPIAIPLGATLADVGTIKGPNDGDSYRPLWIATIEVAQIGADASCVMARARIKENIETLTLRIVDDRLLSPFGGSGFFLRMDGTAVARNPLERDSNPGAFRDLIEWPGDLNLIATVTSDFE
jgi:hypothetical protein